MPELLASVSTTLSTDPPKTLIAVCTLRERGNIVAMLQSLRSACPHADLLVIDDDSADGTAQLAQQFGDADGRTRVVVRQTRGLGSAIVATMSAAIEGGYQYLINLDADFSHDPAATAAMLDHAESSAAGVVVGSRYAAGGRIEGWPLHRRLMSRLVNRLAIARLSLPVTDCSGSMRCYRVGELRRLDPATLTSPGYSVLEEVLQRLAKQGTTMSEIPITFTDRRAGHSKLTAKEAAASLWRIVRLPTS